MAVVYELWDHIFERYKKTAKEVGKGMWKDEEVKNE